MNSGPIAYRYAKALLKYVQESGSGDKVYSQACSLEYIIEELPQMSEYLAAVEDVTIDKKISLLRTALGEDADPAIVSFLKLLSTNRRLDYFPRMLSAFIDQYRQANNIKVGSLVMATEIDGFQDSLEELLSKEAGSQIHLETSLDPNLLGGFVLELDGCRLDASVEGKLAQIRRQLIEPNNRIV